MDTYTQPVTPIIAGYIYCQTAALRARIPSSVNPPILPHERA